MTVPGLGRLIDLVLRLARPDEDPAPAPPLPCERCGTVSSCRYYTPHGALALCLPHALEAVGLGPRGVRRFTVRPHPFDEDGWMVWDRSGGEGVCVVDGDDEATSFTFMGATDAADVLNARAERAARQ